MNEPLSIFMQYFNRLLKQILNASLLLTATGFGFSETATPQEIRKQYLRLQRLTHPDQNLTCPKNIAKANWYQ